MRYLRSQVLAASPQLLDPNFVKTVVLLIEHNEQGALGVVLNRPTKKTLKELWADISGSPCVINQPVHLGGPVSGPIMALHTNQFFAEMEVLPGVFLAAKKENLDQVVAQEHNLLRLFVGHAGWGSGQLENELQEGAWLTAPAQDEYVFYGGDDLWAVVCRRIGSAVIQDALKLKDLPPDPSVN